MDREPLGLGDLGAIGALTDSTRRHLYEFVVTSTRAVGRDEAADAMGIPRQTAAYHLDRLAEEGLVEVEFMRRTGRSGPGAGRPAKLYRRSDRDHEASVPPRRYALAARILLDAAAAGGIDGSKLSEAAHRVGRELAEDGLERGLSETGYEPVEEGREIRFRNCPFHALKEQNQTLVCQLNLGLVEGMLEAASDGRIAHLEPSDSYCCVRIRP
ncbi:MAG TPA: helix-turn-helix domain-containing protein [Acidimicrobiia bacterium]|nr:helix-turn-helix domain-containing protein [Acidimicrobiia bacterium]